MMSSDAGDGGSTPQQVSQYADLRSETAFPLFNDLPKENDIHFPAPSFDAPYRMVKPGAEPTKLGLDAGAGMQAVAGQEYLIFNPSDPI